ncbi:hypothetical protein Rleg5DRAFT_2903 [Rhizobium leguminosarum bv. viciae WSM1455]|nr:hypothetical protein Rleg5DRAFT_2903 [Rhizobium leguminosarum bv. viciae WSM1455]
MRAAVNFKRRRPRLTQSLPLSFIPTSQRAATMKNDSAAIIAMGGAYSWKECEAFSLRT